MRFGDFLPINSSNNQENKSLKDYEGLSIPTKSAHIVQKAQYRTDTSSYQESQEGQGSNKMGFEPEDTTNDPALLDQELGSNRLQGLGAGENGPRILSIIGGELRRAIQERGIKPGELLNLIGDTGRLLPAAQAFVEELLGPAEMLMDDTSMTGQGPSAMGGQNDEGDME